MTVLKITLTALYFGFGLQLLGNYMDRKGYHPMWPLVWLIWPVLWKHLRP